MERSYLIASPFVEGDAFAVYRNHRGAYKATWTVVLDAAVSLDLAEDDLRKLHTLIGEALAQPDEAGES